MKLTAIQQKALKHIWENGYLYRPMWESHRYRHADLSSFKSVTVKSLLRRGLIEDCAGNYRLTIMGEAHAMGLLGISPYVSTEHDEQRRLQDEIVDLYRAAGYNFCDVVFDNSRAMWIDYPSFVGRVTINDLDMYLDPSWHNDLKRYRAAMIKNRELRKRLARYGYSPSEKLGEWID